MLLLPYDMRNKLTCKTINISRRSVITVHYWGLEFWIWVTLNLWMAYSNRQIKHSLKSVQIRTRNNSVFGHISHSETHWKLGVEILIDKFSSWNYKKTPGITNISTTMQQTSAHLGKMCVHTLELSLWKLNKNAAFSFKNTYNKEKYPFLFEVTFLVLFGGCNEEVPTSQIEKIGRL